MIRVYISPRISNDERKDIQTKIKSMKRYVFFTENDNTNVNLKIIDSLEFQSHIHPTIPLVTNLCFSSHIKNFDPFSSTNYGRLKNLSYYNKTVSGDFCSSAELQDSYFYLLEMGAKIIRDQTKADFVITNTDKKDSKYITPEKIKGVHDFNPGNKSHTKMKQLLITSYVGTSENNDAGQMKTNVSGESHANTEIFPPLGAQSCYTDFTQTSQPKKKETKIVYATSQINFSQQGQDDIFDD